MINFPSFFLNFHQRLPLCPAGEDSLKLHKNDRPAQQAPLHLHWLRPNCHIQPACFLHDKYSIWEEMTSQHQDLPQIHWKPNIFQMSFDSWVRHSPVSIPKAYEAKQSGHKTALDRHHEICLLGTKRLRETLHVKLELLFFSLTLGWVVSSC